MKKNFFTGFVTGLLLALMAVGASATMITMENGDRFADHGFDTTSMFDSLFANPYGGGGWSSGYDTVLTSGSYVAFRQGGSGAATISLSGGGTWDFTGAFWASAWDNTDLLTLNGYNGANLLYTTSNTVYRQSKTWIQSDFTGITQLSITGLSNQTAFDDFVYNESDIAPVPEPSTVLLFVTGLAGLVGINRRKKK